MSISQPFDQPQDFSAITWVLTAKLVLESD
jgi:hypothetical protein